MPQFILVTHKSKWFWHFGTQFERISSVSLGEQIIDMFRVTEILQDDKTVTLRLDGRVVGPCVSELEKSCQHWRLEKEKTVVLDFSGVSFIDRIAVSMLERIKDERVKIINCSPFIGSLLHDLIADR